MVPGLRHKHDYKARGFPPVVLTRVAWREGLLLSDFHLSVSYPKSITHEPGLRPNDGRADRVFTSLRSCLIHQGEQFCGGVPIADGHKPIDGK
jgi:hypothetical protein